MSLAWWRGLDGKFADVLTSFGMVPTPRVVTPLLNLQLAVLEDAIKRLHQGRRCSVHGQKAARAEREWLESSESGYVFSFRCICEQMGVDAAAARSAILAQAHPVRLRHVKQLGSSRPQRIGSIGAYRGNRGRVRLAKGAGV